MTILKLLQNKATFFLKYFAESQNFLILSLLVIQSFFNNSIFLVLMLPELKVCEFCFRCSFIFSWNRNKKSNWNFALHCYETQTFFTTCVSLYKGVEYELSPILGPVKKNRFYTLEGTNVWEPCEIMSLYLKLTKKIH